MMAGSLSRLAHAVVVFVAGMVGAGYLTMLVILTVAALLDGGGDVEC